MSRATTNLAVRALWEPRHSTPQPREERPRTTPTAGAGYARDRNRAGLAKADQRAAGLQHQGQAGTSRLDCLGVSPSRTSVLASVRASTLHRSSMPTTHPKEPACTSVPPTSFSLVSGSGRLRHRLPRRSAHLPADVPGPDQCPPAVPRGVVLIDDVVPCDAASALADYSAAYEIPRAIGTDPPTRRFGMARCPRSSCASPCTTRSLPTGPSSARAESRPLWGGNSRCTCGQSARKPSVPSIRSTTARCSAT